MAGVRSLGQRLRAARQRKRWSQAELAERLGASLNTVSRWECGHTTPCDWWNERLRNLSVYHVGEGESLRVWRLTETPPTWVLTAARSAKRNATTNESDLALRRSHPILRASVRPDPMDTRLLGRGPG